jgi:hypothetical protein
MRNTELFKASYLVPKKAKPDQEKSSLYKLNQDPKKKRENLELLTKFNFYYGSLQNYRDRRKRSRDYERGNQWDDLTTNDAGQTLTEKELIESQGRIALVHNIIRQLTRNLIPIHGCKRPRFRHRRNGTGQHNNQD